jgi:hypothetical protein
MRSATFFVRGRLLLQVSALQACTTSSPLPGTSEGTFGVVATLTTNTCGSGIDAPNPWDFSVWLSEDGSTLYIEDTDGTGEMSGALSSAAATLTTSVTSDVDATEAGAGECNLTQAISIALNLNSGTAPTSFTGTATYTYSAATGVSTTNNCTDQLASSGGTYETLPCTVTYSLAGTKQ